MTKLVTVLSASAVVVLGINGTAIGAPNDPKHGRGAPADGALHHHGKGNFDGRKGSRGPTAEQRQLAAAQHNAHVDWNRFGTPLQIASVDGKPVATDLPADPEAAARAYISANRALFGLSQDAVDGLKLVSVHPIGQGSAVVLQQSFGDLSAGYDGMVNVGLVDGKVYYVSSSLARQAPKPPSATLSETDAIKTAASDAGLDLGTLTARGESDGWKRYSASALDGQQSVRLVAVPLPDGSVRATYEVGLNSNGDEPEAYTSYVDGRTGEVLIRQDNVHEEIDNPEWKAFPANPPADYSSTDTRETWCWTPATGCDRVVGNPSSPLAWDIDPSINSTASSTTSRGNNAQTARTWTGSFSLNNVATSRPNRDYTFAWTNQWYESKCSPDAFTTGNLNDIDAAITNLNAMHNRMHDWSYKLGFTEINRNMQVNNFDRGGRANDPERGSAQSGARSATLTRNNANQSTPTDGSPGSTNMYLWQPVAGSFYPPCVDGDYDMSVIAHEYTHAISNRMVNGGLSGTQAGSMGESWSDLDAMEYLYEYNLVPKGQTYSVTGQYATGNPVRGIRNFDIGDSPLNYSNFGFDLTGPEVHADGEIWNAVQWEVRQAFVDRYGSGTPELNASCADGLTALESCPGNRRWIQNVYDAWLLMPRAVTMVGARDAMLAADQIRTGGVNQALMWDAFAKRGLGSSATATSGSDVTPKPGFDSPNANNATIRFVPAGEAPSTAKMQVFIGDFQARSRPIVSVDPAKPGSDTATIAPGTYHLFVQAPGYGLTRLTATFKPGQTGDFAINLQQNLAAAANGATATGDGVNAAYLIDENEGSQWAYLGAKAEPIAGKQTTVKLAGDGPQVVRRINVSALLRPAKTGDPGGDNAAQNRFTALRSFQVLACTASATVDCTNDKDYRLAYTSAEDAFPAERPRPVSPSINLRSFDIPTTLATHLRLVVGSSQCTGNPAYAGQQSNDPNVPSDCTTAFASSGQVRIAEFQAFENPPPCTTTITGRHSDPLTVNSGVTCLDGAQVSGPVTVKPGASLIANGATVSGPVSASRAGVVRLCGTTVSGPVDLADGELVTIGDQDHGCAPVTITGPLTVSRSTMRVIVTGATVSGPVNVVDNTGSTAPIVAGNRIGGPLSCSGNVPAPANNGQVNTASGPKKGQCVGL
ncbi:M36 family metallopeptidase [Streptosporangium sp. NPDC087985]|uniref:M36 family metallopeptidase n=1 Tax=Streptosporangium sp. NPDC087985 TaxID=3366196 RepID=UPI00382936A4